MSYTPKEKVGKICALPSCGLPFETAKERQRFHSDECRLTYIKTIQNMNHCPHCGKELLGA